MWILFGVIGSLVFLLIISLAIYLFSRNRRCSCNKKLDEEHELENMRIPFLEQLEIDTDRIRILELLGKGCFASVWKATVSSSEQDDAQIVAVKMLKGNLLFLRSAQNLMLFIKRYRVLTG